MEDRRQNFIIESLKGIHTIKSMAMEALMLRRYEKLQHQSAESVYELSRVNSIVQGIGATFSQLAVVIFVGVGSLFVIEGRPDCRCARSRHNAFKPGTATRP